MYSSKSSSKHEASKKTPQAQIVDRTMTCPFLMRVFIGNAGHNSLSEYSRGKFPFDEVQVYTWYDATLKELTQLIREVKPDFRRTGTNFDFSLVFPAPRSDYGYRCRSIGSTCAGVLGSNDAKTLFESDFHIGDYMDIAVDPPEQRPRHCHYNPHYTGHDDRVFHILRAGEVSRHRRFPWQCD